MTPDPFVADKDATPLEPEERHQLIPTYLTTRAQLNEIEQIGVSDADRWAFARRRQVLDADFLRRLHKRMFGAVWRWAGEFRTTPRNIGVDAWRISAELDQLLDEARYWVRNETFEPDEIAARFHHRLVAIHPFPNGNGRLSRLAADLFVTRLGRPRFSWGAAMGQEAAVVRSRYVEALRAADRHDIGPLLAFVRS